MCLGNIIFLILSKPLLVGIVLILWAEGSEWLTNLPRSGMGKAFYGLSNYLGGSSRT